MSAIVLRRREARRIGRPGPSAQEPEAEADRELTGCATGDGTRPARQPKVATRRPASPEAVLTVRVEATQGQQIQVIVDRSTTPMDHDEAEIRLVLESLTGGGQPPQ